MKCTSVVFVALFCALLRNQAQQPDLRVLVVPTTGVSTREVPRPAATIREDGTLQVSGGLSLKKEHYGDYFSDLMRKNEHEFLLVCSDEAQISVAHLTTLLQDIRESLPKRGKMTILIVVGQRRHQKERK